MTNRVPLYAKPEKFLEKFVIPIDDKVLRKYKVLEILQKNSEIIKIP